MGRYTYRYFDKLKSIDIDQLLFLDDQLTKNNLSGYWV